MNEKEYPNMIVKLMALVRPGDVLRASIQSILHHGDYDITLCSTLYEVTEQLHSIEPNKPVILLSRPAMLANASFLSLVQRHTGLRMIGWISQDENPADKAFAMTANAGLIMVSSLKQLEEVIAALKKSFIREIASEPKSDQCTSEKIEQEAYRLSNEELDALLGSG